MSDGIGDSARSSSRLCRRSVLGGIAALCGLAGGRNPAHAAMGQGAYAWQDWATSFLMPDGRVVDPQQGGISHSEGQAYGLLLAQSFGDEMAFRRIEAWTRSNLGIRQDRLLAWKWSPGPGQGAARDWHNATDGDLLRAWALLRATRDSGWQGFEATYREIARDLVAICLAPDPRAPSEVLLVPGAESRREKDRVLVNPSYFMPRALRELGEAAAEPALVRCADHAETVLSELAAADLLVDWVDITGQGFAAPLEHDLRWGYDALRIPLYLVWSGRRSHPAVRRAREMMLQAPVRDHVAVVIRPDGRIEAMSDQDGFRAIAELAICQPHHAGNQSRIARDPAPYYPASLDLLAQVALREGGC